MNKRIALFFGLLVAMAATTAWAEDSHDHGHEQEAFNASNFIIHHIADAHDIHLWGDVHIPLPIIVYTAEHGLDVFMSSAFEGHGEVRVVERPSGVTYELSHGHIAVAGDHADHGHDDHAGHDHETHGDHDHAGHDHADHAGHDHGAHEGHDQGNHGHHGPVVYDLSITKSIFGMLLMLGLMVLLFGRMAGSYKSRQGQAPTGMTNALEPLVLFLRDEIAIPNIGKEKADKFLPFLMTVFFFIFFANLLGLVPFIGGFNVTGTLGITMVLASLVFLITTLNGNKHYWGHLFWPPRCAFVCDAHHHPHRDRGNVLEAHRVDDPFDSQHQRGPHHHLVVCELDSHLRQRRRGDGCRVRHRHLLDGLHDFHVLPRTPCGVLASVCLYPLGRDLLR